MTVSWVLWIVGALSAILAGVLAFALAIVLLSGDLSGHSAREAQREGVSGLLVAILAAVIVLGAGIVLSYTNSMRNGSRSARTVLTVLGILIVVVNVAQESHVGQGGGVTVNVGLSALFTILAIVLMWLPGANRYFDNRYPRR